jgi:hypothetical protein
MNGKRDPIGFDEKGFFIRGERVLLVGGEFHYFRTPADLWEDRLVKMRRAGANLLSTYVPWNWHEPVEGNCRWDGDRDLSRFLGLCAANGLFVIVKPGPYCCAELYFGGHPDWLLGRDIRIRRLDEAYLSLVREWYRRVAEVINPHLITRGGNVVCVQVENEYDHLLNYGKDRISIEDAISYFMKLGRMLEDSGIDVPKIANEAEFLRGRGIIDTRTYYPNIPTFHDWMWEFEHYDEKIAKAGKEQPACPTMIMELQKGWFGAHGHPNYYPELNHTQAVAKSALIQGASVLNFYMFTGGTTFPFWGCRADEWAADRWGTVCIFNPVGCGVTTSYDFGGSFIREWGELLDRGYSWVRAFNRFVGDFQELVAESGPTDEIEVISGGGRAQLIRRGGAVADAAFSDELQKLRVMAKEWNGQYLVCIRNLSPEDRTVDLGWKQNRETVFGLLDVRARETILLPVNVRIQASGVVVLKSTSELLFSREIGNRVFFGLFGKKGRTGTTVLNVPADRCTVLSGDVRIRPEGAGSALVYAHSGVQIVRVDRHLLFILDEEKAGQLDVLERGILLSDAYFIRSIEQGPDGIGLRADFRLDSRNAFSYFGEDPLRKVEIDGRDVPVRREGSSLLSEFSWHCPPDDGDRLEWTGDWKVLPDSDEAKEDFDDSGWTELNSPTSLEAAGLLEHGYTWFRSAFDIPPGCSNAALFFTGNDIDRQFIFINGRLVRRGRFALSETKIGHAIRPGRNVLAVLYQNFFHTKSHPHEGPILKFSGILEPAVVEGVAAGGGFRVEISRFRVRQHLSGILKGFMESDYDDSAWPSVEPSEKYIMHEDVGTILWMRRKFRYTRRTGFRSAVKLRIPGAEFRCLIHVNGKPAGWYEAIGPQEDFYIPDNFLRGENVLSIILEGPRGFLREPVLDTFIMTREAGIRMRF